MIVATIAAELFTEQNQFPTNFINLIGLPFPKFALQPILLRNTNFQIDTEKTRRAWVAFQPSRISKQNPSGRVIILTT
jgi:hypothetical protein